MTFQFTLTLPTSADLYFYSPTGIEQLAGSHSLTLFANVTLTTVTLPNVHPGNAPIPKTPARSGSVQLLTTVIPYCPRSPPSITLPTPPTTPCPPFCLPHQLDYVHHLRTYTSFTSFATPTTFAAAVPLPPNLIPYQPVQGNFCPQPHIHHVHQLQLRRQLRHTQNLTHLHLLYHV